MGYYGATPYRSPILPILGQGCKMLLHLLLSFDPASISSIENRLACEGIIVLLIFDHFINAKLGDLEFLIES